MHRFDGKAWHTVGTTHSGFAGVWVERPEEIYVTSRSGVLLDGSANGLIERAKWDGPLVGVAKWQGAVWLGGEEKGLLKLAAAENGIESIKPNIFTRYMDAREHLMIAAEKVIIFSADGLEFKGFGKTYLQDTTANDLFLGRPPRAAEEDDDDDV